MSKYSLDMLDLNAYVTKPCNSLSPCNMELCLLTLQNQLFHFTEHVETLWWIITIVFCSLYINQMEGEKKSLVYIAVVCYVWSLILLFKTFFSKTFLALIASIFLKPSLFISLQMLLSLSGWTYEARRSTCVNKQGISDWCIIWRSKRHNYSSQVEVTILFTR